MYTLKKYRIKNEAEFDNLETIWNDLQSGKDMTVFQSFEWNKLLFEEWFRLKINILISSIFIYVVYHDEKPVMIAPFIVQKLNTKTRWFGKKRGIYVLGYNSYSDYLNFIYQDFHNKALSFLFNQVHKDFHRMKIYLTDFPEWTSTSPALRDLQAVETKCTVSIAVKIENDLNTYNSMISKHTRQNLRTSLNRMKRDGICYEIEVSNKIHDKELLEKLREIHIERMCEKNINRSDLVHYISSKIRIFVRKRKERKNNIIFQSMQSESKSELVIVKLNGNIAGYLYGLRDNKTVRIMQNCFKSDYSFYSPLFRCAYDYIKMQYESSSNMKWVDFTRGNEEYKYKLAGIETKLYSFII